jgi:hypothetical protein
MRAIILTAGLLLSIGATISSQRAWAEDKAMRIECNPGYHWAQGQGCVRDDQLKREDTRMRPADVKCDAGFLWDERLDRCVRKEQR